MRYLLAVASFLLAFGTYAVGGQTNPDPKSFYQAHQWFELRDAMGVDWSASPYGAILADAFNDQARAEKLSRTMIHSDPQSARIGEAWQALEDIYYRAGRFKKLRAVLREELKAKPTDNTLKSELATFSELSWDQSTAAFHYSKLSYQLVGTGISVPVVINGRSATYFVDTDANVSVLSESEAARMGLTVLDARRGSEELSGSSGGHIGFRTVVAKEFEVGKVRLKNVSFLVLPDHQEPFVDLPSGSQGIIGLPVLLAFQTIRWNANGTFEIAFPSGRTDHAKSNLCFDGPNLLTEGEFRGQKLQLVLDTGDDNFYLFPLFAKRFATFVSNSGTKETSRMTGFDGSRDVSSLLLPELRLRVGGFDATLHPATVLLEQTIAGSEWFDGRVGMALLKQAHQVTIDFRSMSLTLQ